MAQASTSPVDAPAVGTPLVLSTNGTSDPLVRAQGTLFLVTDPQGDITPAGARELGLFFADTRYLSFYELTLSGGQLVNLSSDATNDAHNQVDQMLSGLDRKSELDDPQHFVHVRRRQLLDEDFTEQITLTNFLRRAVTLDVRVHFDADFADIFEVRGARRARRGRKLVPRVESGHVEIAYEGVDGCSYATRVAFSPAPVELSAHEARFALTVPAGATTRLEVSVCPVSGGRPRRVPQEDFDARAARIAKHARDFRESSSRVECDNGLIQLAIDRSVADLQALRLDLDGGQILAAGIPWFCCPFGRDALLASYEALVLNPALAVDSLRTLAKYQGHSYNDETEEEPGKIFHELRFGEMTKTSEMPHRPYYGSIDSTPLFVVVAHAAYEITGDLALMRELRGSIVAALEWIDRRSASGKKLVSYERRASRGLDNQGWKDSRAGVSYPDGTPAEPPIALCEVQGYCVDAYARGARILEALGERSLASEYADRSDALRDRIDHDYWLADKGRYAFAIDGKGHTLDTIVSNVGHLLWSRVASPERARATADLLIASDSFSGYGVRTLARAQAVYNPLSYHNGTVWPHDNALIAKGMANYRLTGHATQIFEGMVAAMAHFRDSRLPELFCGFDRSDGSVVAYPVACRPQAWAAAAPFLFLQAMLGIDIDGPAGTLTIRNARMPPSMSRVEIHGLHVGRSRASVRFRRVGRHCHVDQLDFTGAPLRTVIELD